MVLFQTVAVAGASGTLGQKIIEHLLDVPGITKITALTRSAPPVEDIHNPIISYTQVVTYEHHTELVKALRGHDLLVSGIAGAVACTRFMPSEYTVDVMHPHSVAFAGSTILATKIASAKKLDHLVQAGKIEYTTLVTGPLLDFWVSQKVEGIVDLNHNAVMLYDGGEYQVTGCSLDFVSLCVGAVVTMPQDATRNRRMRVAETQCSGKELVRVLEEVTGKKWTGVQKTTEALVVESLAARNERGMTGFYVGQILKVAFDGEGSCYFAEGAAFGKALRRHSLQDIIRRALVTE